MGVVANVIKILVNDQQWAGVVAHDELVHGTVAMRAPPWSSEERGALARSYPSAWEDADSYRLVNWLGQNYDMIVPPHVVDSAIEVVAARTPVHPVRDWLKKLQRDGKERVGKVGGDVPSWLTTYAGAEDTPYNRVVGRIFLIGAIARIMNPGCQLDTAPVFEGAQGSGKTSLLRILARRKEWYLELTETLGSKDSMQLLWGKWLVELGELDSFSRSELTAIKSFTTRLVDTFRVPYGKRVANFLRQVAMAGTTNQDTYLKDDTGNRRWLAVRCGTIDLIALERDADQLWAEAYAAYQAGEQWRIDDPEIRALAATEAEKRRQAHPWELPITRWLARRPESVLEAGIGTHDILTKVLGLEVGRLQRSDEMTVAGILRNVCGMERRQARIGSGREWRYFRPSVKVEAVGDKNGDSDSETESST